MAELSVIHNTFVIERIYPKPAERVFAAFSDAGKKRRWFADGMSQTAVESFEMDFRVGGAERAQYRFKEGSLFPGVVMVHAGSFQNIVPDNRIISASTMTFGDHCISATLATFEFVPTAGGTILKFTHQAAFFENSDGPKMREDGWQKLFEKLAKELAQ